MPLDGYQPRIADAELATRLRSSGAVVIEGPRACGSYGYVRKDGVQVIPIGALGP